MPKELPLIAIGMDQRLIYARKEAKLTLSQVAIILGVASDAVWCWEQQGYIPSDKMFERLAILYDVRIDYLKTGALATK